MQSICREINRTFHLLTDSEPNPHIKLELDTGNFFDFALSLSVNN